MRRRDRWAEAVRRLGGVARAALDRAAKRGRPIEDAAAVDVWRLVRVDGRPEGRLAVSLLGLDGRALPGILASLTAGGRPAGDLVLFVSDPDFASLVAAGAAVEFLPTRRGADMVDGARWERFLRRKRDVALLAWGVAAELSVGLPFEEFVARELGSGAAAPSGGVVSAGGSAVRAAGTC